jgi:hypothetical protein
MPVSDTLLSFVGGDMSAKESSASGDAPPASRPSEVMLQ